jgi:hypothetical protein
MKRIRKNIKLNQNSYDKKHFLNVLIKRRHTNLKINRDSSVHKTIATRVFQERVDLKPISIFILVPSHLDVNLMDAVKLFQRDLI